MGTLLRADLRRILNPHGNFLGYFIALVIFTVLTVVGAPLLVRLMAGMYSSGEADVAAGLGTTYASTLNMMTSILSFGFVGLMTCWSSCAICFTDIRAGFERTIVSSCGKKAYYTEKLVLALVLSVIFVIVGGLLALLAGSLFIGGQIVSGPVSIVMWLALSVVVSWACACLCLAVLWILRNNTVAFLLALTLGSGLVSGVAVMATSAMPDLAQTISSIREWLPVGAYTVLETVTDGELVLSGEQLAKVFVPSAVCVAAGFLTAARVLPKRDL